MADAEKKHRSPAYPFISLKKALERAKTLYEHDKRHPTPLPVAAKHWGYGEKSSGGLQTVSALKQYALLEDVGGGGGRRVKLTDLALAILLDEVPNSPDRAKAVKRAALNPKLYAEMFEKWGIELPSDESVRTYLKRDKLFNDDAVGGVIKDYKDTLEYAKLTESDKIPESEAQEARDLEANVQENITLRDQKPLTLQDGILSLSVPYGAKGSVLTVQVKLAGERLKPSHIAKVRKYLELAEVDLTENGEDAS